MRQHQAPTLPRDRPPPANKVVRFAKTGIPHTHSRQSRTYRERASFHKASPRVHTNDMEWRAWSQVCGSTWNYVSLGSKEVCRWRELNQRGCVFLPTPAYFNDTLPLKSKRCLVPKSTVLWFFVCICLESRTELNSGVSSTQRGAWRPQMSHRVKPNGSTEIVPAPEGAPVGVYSRKIAGFCAE
jgi:hypothetical protein